MRIKIQELSKTYRGGFEALSDINLEINTGMFGLLGPNGAGKTTLLRILATLLAPTRGRVTVDGFDVSDRHQKWAVKQLLGYLPQELGLYASLTVTEFLDYIATLKNLHNPLVRHDAVEKGIALAGLRSVAHQRIHTLSGGMKRRVGIAQALLGDPRLLIVDEPTAGLDPEERVRFRNLLVKLSGESVVILSTHIVEDIAATCHDMAVLHLGSLRFRGSPSELVSGASGLAWEAVLPSGQLPDPSWRIASQVQDGEALRVRIVGHQPTASAAGITIKPVTATLEEAYLVLMSGKAQGLTQ
jgi:ABC-2 type transport system ATP-binding protein